MGALGDEKAMVIYKKHDVYVVSDEIIGLIFFLNGT